MTTLRTAPALATPTPLRPDPSPAANPAAQCVAVCDDDVRFIRLVERMLDEVDVGIVPVTTLDARDAVRVIAEAGCDAALIDLNIYNDGQAGLTLLRLLRGNPQTAGMPLLLATAAPLRDVRRHDAELRALQCGVLTKPFSVDALFDALGVSAPPLPAA